MKLLKYYHRGFTHMRFAIVTAIILLLNLINFAQVFENSIKKGTLIVRINGFSNDKGECWFALDNSQEVYESEDSVFIGKILPIKNGEVIVNIDSLEYGNYAIKVFHDEDSNRELDSNFLGIPTEDYGFSNNVSAWIGSPRWERAKFLFNEKKMTLKISVK